MKTSIIDLSARDANLEPGKLDTMVKVDGGVVDTRLSPAALAMMQDSLTRNPEVDWKNIVNTSTDIHEVNLAKRRLLEIALVRLAVSQLISEEDGSQRIGQIELELYGHYSTDLYRLAIERKIRQIETLDLPHYVIGAEEVRAGLLDELNEFLPDTVGSESYDTEPNAVTLSKIQEWIFAQFEDVFDYIDSLEYEELDANAMKGVFDLCINTTPALRDARWQCVVIDREKTAVSVYATENKIVIAKKRKAQKAVLKRLVVHEVFGHALRSALAGASKDVVGRIGTASYQSFEESFEITLEQCLTGKYNPMRGVDHCLAIGLALTSHKSKEDIAQLFNKFTQLQEIEKTQREIDQIGVERSEASARGQIRRTFAGQTDVDDGIPHVKDIDYLYGTTGAWSLLNEIVRLNIVDEGMRWLLSAKFNPFNEDDRALVERYHPMPKSLRPFFS